VGHQSRRHSLLRSWPLGGRLSRCPCSKSGAELRGQSWSRQVLQWTLPFRGISLKVAVERVQLQYETNFRAGERESLAVCCQGHTADGRRQPAERDGCQSPSSSFTPQDAWNRRFRHAFWTSCTLKVQPYFRDKPGRSARQAVLGLCCPLPADPPLQLTGVARHPGEFRNRANRSSTRRSFLLQDLQPASKATPVTVSSRSFPHYLLPTVLV
jgi:hypothetical protein